MKKLLLGTLSLAALVGAVPALAADMAVRPAAPVVSNWNGWYVGINAGGGFSSQDDQLTAASNTGVIRATFLTTAFGLPLWSTGALGGFQVGWNWQAGWWLVGIEADIDCANITGRADFTFPAPFFQVGITNTLDRLGTVRGRLGVLAGNNYLLYGTGGFAYGRNTLLVNAMGTGTGAVNNANQDTATKTGWTAGGGAEWNFYQNWTVKGEYLYVDLGSQTVTTNATTPGFGFDAATVSHNDRYHIVRFGLNYIFGGLGKGVVASY